MTARMTDAPVPLEDYVPAADSFVIMRGDWAAYEALLAAREERSKPRIAYLDGVLQLMSPSRDHDLISRTLGHLVGHYCPEVKIAYTGVGSWTLRDKLRKAGLEPDECFIFGDDPKSKPRPDLAIEAVWTSGGIEKLEIYRRLSVGEVWFWKKGAIVVFVLRDGAYVQVERSACLPAVDLALLARLAVVEPTSTAVDELLAALRAGGS